MNGYEKAIQVEKEAMPELLEFLGQQSDNGRFVLTAKGRLSRELQKTYGDALMNTPDGSLWAVEFKVERRFTGNFFIETWSNRSRFTRGWLDHLNTNVLLYYFLDVGRLYSIDFPKLKRWAFGHAEGAGRLYSFREVKQKRHDQINDTWGRVVPVAVVEAEIGCRRWERDRDRGGWGVAKERSATPLFDAAEALT